MKMNITGFFAVKKYSCDYVIISFITEGYYEDLFYYVLIVNEKLGVRKWTAIERENNPTVWITYQFNNLIHKIKYVWDKQDVTHIHIKMHFYLQLSSNCLQFVHLEPFCIDDPGK